MLVPETDFATVEVQGHGCGNHHPQGSGSRYRGCTGHHDRCDGKVELYVNVDQKLGEVNLVASESLERKRSSGLLAGGRISYSPGGSGRGLFCCAAAYRIHYPLNINHNCRRRKKKMRRVNKNSSDTGVANCGKAGDRSRLFCCIWGCRLFPQGRAGGGKSAFLAKTGAQKRTMGRKGERTKSPALLLDRHPPDGRDKTIVDTAGAVVCPFLCPRGAVP